MDAVAGMTMGVPMRVDEVTDGLDPRFGGDKGVAGAASCFADIPPSRSSVLASSSMRCVVLLVLLAASAPAAAATVRGPAGVADLAASAEAVLHARVIARESRWGAGGESSGLIFTRVTLQPIEWWKGGGAPARVVVRVPGGSVGDLTQTVDGMAEFAPQEEVVVFLHKLGDEAGTAVYSVERFALGKFSIGRPAGGPARAWRDRNGVACIGCDANEEDDLSVPELRERVRRAARSAR